MFDNLNVFKQLDLIKYIKPRTFGPKRVVRQDRLQVTTYIFRESPFNLPIGTDHYLTFLENDVGYIVCFCTNYSINYLKIKRTSIYEYLSGLHPRD
ncbi:hypothetical protein [Chryseobacterium chendengshani]|uniref:hypothetical protein n=1 Tax=Chryseobacterium sp. LJ756 TaxID=2864113 RepID=UPI001C644278|nr:hypothetical protein [Chryseobacterium sp. LJ756]MBW7675097.1 hypothetical protein [Chryseobacterium sp. LJ756]